MAKMKRGGRTGKKGGSVIADELNNPTPKRKNNKNQKGKKRSKGK